MMKIAVACLAALVLLAAIGQAPAKPSPEFTCSIGSKRVSVTKSGNRFVYRFGTAAGNEISIEGVPAEGNVLRLSQSFDGEENQIRFKQGEFSYIVFSTSGNPSVGARAIAGLVVKRGTSVISDKTCSQFTDRIFADEDYWALPEDDAAFSAM